MMVPRELKMVQLPATQSPPLFGTHRRTKRRSGFLGSMRSPPVTTKGRAGTVCIGHDRGGWRTDRNRNQRRGIRCDKTRLRWRRKSKKLMRSITSKELPIAECQSSGTVDFNYVLVVILDFHNYATTIPSSWEAI